MIEYKDFRFGPSHSRPQGVFLSGPTTRILVLLIPLLNLLTATTQAADPSSPVLPSRAVPTRPPAHASVQESSLEALPLPPLPLISNPDLPPEAFHDAVKSVKPSVSAQGRGIPPESVPAGRSEHWVTEPALVRIDHEILDTDLTRLQETCVPGLTGAGALQRHIVCRGIFKPSRMADFYRELAARLRIATESPLDGLPSPERHIQIHFPGDAYRSPTITTIQQLHEAFNNMQEISHARHRESPSPPAANPLVPVPPGEASSKPALEPRIEPGTGVGQGEVILPPSPEPPPPLQVRARLSFTGPRHQIHIPPPSRVSTPPAPLFELDKPVHCLKDQKTLHPSAPSQSKSSASPPQQHPSQPPVKASRRKAPPHAAAPYPDVIGPPGYDPESYDERGFYRPNQSARQAAVGLSSDKGRRDSTGDQASGYSPRSTLKGRPFPDTLPSDPFGYTGEFDPYSSGFGDPMPSSKKTAPSSPFADPFSSGMDLEDHPVKYKTPEDEAFAKRYGTQPFVPGSLNPRVFDSSNPIRPAGAQSRRAPVKQAAAAVPARVPAPPPTGEDPRQVSTVLTLTNPPPFLPVVQAAFNPAAVQEVVTTLAREINQIPTAQRKAAYLATPIGPSNSRGTAELPPLTSGSDTYPFIRHLILKLWGLQTRAGIDIINPRIYVQVYLPGQKEGTKLYTHRQIGDFIAQQCKRVVFSRLQTDDLDSPPPKTQNFLARSTPLSLWAVAESIVDAQSLIEVYPELVKSNKVVPALGPVVVNIDIKQPFQVIYRYLVHTVFPQVVARSRNGAARVLPRDIQLDLQIQYKNSKGETIKSEPAKITGNHFQATLLASLQAIDSLKIPIITAGISLQGQEEDQAIVDWLNEEAPTRYQWGQLEKMVLAELPRVAPRDAQAAITRSNEILDRLRELLQGQCSREQFEEALRNAGDAPHLVSCQEISPFLEQLSPGIIVLSAKASELIHSSPQDIIRFAHRLGTLGRGPNLKLAEDPADPQFRVPLSELLTRLREDRDSED